MLKCFRRLICAFCFSAFCALVHVSPVLSATSLERTLQDTAGKPVGNATVKLRDTSAERKYAATTSPDGGFKFHNIPSGSYAISASRDGNFWTMTNPLTIQNE